MYLNNIQGHIWMSLFLECCGGVGVKYWNILLIMLGSKVRTSPNRSYRRNFIKRFMIGISRLIRHFGWLFCFLSDVLKLILLKNSNFDIQCKNVYSVSTSDTYKYTSVLAYCISLQRSSIHSQSFSYSRKNCKMGPEG